MPMDSHLVITGPGSWATTPSSFCAAATPATASSPEGRQPVPSDKDSDVGLRRQDGYYLPDLGLETDPSLDAGVLPYGIHRRLCLGGQGNANGIQEQDVALALPVSRWSFIALWERRLPRHSPMPMGATSSQTCILKIATLYSAPLRTIIRARLIWEETMPWIATQQQTARHSSHRLHPGRMISPGMPATTGCHPGRICLG